MNNTLVRLKGWVTESHLIKPEKNWIDNEEKYRFQMMLSENVYDELEHQIEEYVMATSDPFLDARGEQKVMRGTTIHFESIYPPRMFGSLLNAEWDADLIGEQVQAVGHLQRLENGDILLSSHILEPIDAPRYDPMDDAPEDSSTDWDF